MHIHQLSCKYVESEQSCSMRTDRQTNIRDEFDVHVTAHRDKF